MKKSLFLLGILCLSYPILAENLGFIHSETFMSVNKDYPRSGLESEITLSLRCEKLKNSISREIFNKNLFTNLHKNNWSMSKKLSKCDVCEAFSYPLYPIGNDFQSEDDIRAMNWDEKSHALRESSPYFWVAVEPERISQISKFKRDFTLGVDLMDDIYFDSSDYLGIQNNYTLRARKRWDNWRPQDPVSIRRLLVGLKHNEGVDPKTGMKLAKKMDTRFDYADNESIQSITTQIPNGISNWYKSTFIFPAVYELYTSLASKGLLKDDGNYKQILKLEPQVLNRSLRMRYHMNALNTGAPLYFYKNAIIKAQKLLSLLDSKNLNTLEFKRYSKYILDPSAFIDFYKDITFPDYTIENQNSLLKYKEASEWLNEIFHGAGKEIRNLAAAIANRKKRQNGKKNTQLIPLY